MLRSACLRPSFREVDPASWAARYSIVAGRTGLSIRAGARGCSPAGGPGGCYGRALSDVPAGRSTVVDSVTESTLAREKKMGK